MVQAALRIALTALMLVVASTAAYAASARLDDVKVSTEDNVTVVMLHTSRVPRYTAELIDSPNRLVLDLEDTAFGWRAGPLAAPAEPVKAVRGSQFRKDRVRVVIELTRRAGFVVREDSQGLAVMIPAPTPTASPDTSASRPVAPQMVMAAANVPAPPVPPREPKAKVAAASSDTAADAPTTTESPREAEAPIAAQAQTPP